MTIIKDANSLEGWNFKDWFLGNWKTIKEISKVGAPLLISWVTTKDPVLSGFLTLLGKFLLDTGEYYIKTHTK